MITRLLIVVALIIIFSVSIIYFIPDEKEQKKEQREETSKRESELRKNLQETTDQLEIEKEFGDHPVYDALQENFSEISSRMVYLNDINITYLEAKAQSDTNKGHFTLHIYKDTTYEKQYASNVSCSIGYLYVDELRGPDNIVIDYIKNSVCSNREYDQRKENLTQGLPSFADNDTESSFESHPAYIVMKQRFPESVDKTFLYDDSGDVGVDVDVTNPENKNHLKLRIYGNSGNDISDTWITCSVEGHTVRDIVNPTLEYIAHTDCLEQKRDPNYEYAYKESFYRGH